MTHAVHALFHLVERRRLPELSEAAHPESGPRRYLGLLPGRAHDRLLPFLEGFPGQQYEGHTENLLLFLEELRGDLFACDQYEDVQERIDTNRPVEQRILLIGDQDAQHMRLRLEDLTDEAEDGSAVWQEFSSRPVPEDLSLQLRQACELLASWLAQIDSDHIGVLVFVTQP